MNQKFLSAPGTRQLICWLPDLVIVRPGFGIWMTILLLLLNLCSDIASRKAELRFQATKTSHHSTGMYILFSEPLKKKELLLIELFVVRRNTSCYWIVWRLCAHLDHWWTTGQHAWAAQRTYFCSQVEQKRQLHPQCWCRQSNHNSSQ